VLKCAIKKRLIVGRRKWGKKKLTRENARKKMLSKNKESGKRFKYVENNKKITNNLDLWGH
jgi:hypothetical protein